jgi:hypothetical protein
VVGNVRFDGFDYAQNAYIEAKGPGYIDEGFYFSNGQPRSWFKGYGDMLNQLLRQDEASNGREVRWYVVNEFSAQVVRRAIADLRLGDNFAVIVQAPRP